MEKIIDKAMKDIKGKLLSVADQIAYEISWTIQEKYENCVQLFYNDYTPWVYDRGYNTYEASSGGHDLSLHNSVADLGDRIEITAGIDINSDRLGSPYKDGTEYVFNRTWQWGIHGTMFTGGWMSPSPKMKMDEWYKQFKQSDYRRIVNKYLSGIGLQSNMRR